MRKSHYLMLFLISVCVLGCGPERKETPEKGHVTVLVSESVGPVVKQEQQEFEDMYKEATVDIKVTTAREAIVQFFNTDSIRNIVSSRPFNAEEREVAKRSHISIDEYKIAVDGIAIIIHKDNPVTQLRTTQLDSIYRGMTTSWSRLGWKKSSASIAVCLPDQNAGEFEVVATKILHGQRYATPAEVVHSSSDMIHFVEDHANAIGMVNVAWLPDYKDKVKSLELSDPDAPDSLGIRGQFFGPHQAYLYQGYYPLTSDVYIYSRADMYSLGAGFITFVCSAPGQKIVLSSGLVPATMPVRLVEMTKKSL